MLNSNSYPSAPGLQLCQFDFKAMGSPCEILIYAENATVAAEIIHLAVNEIYRLETQYSRFIPHNFMAAVNTAAHNGTSAPIDKECLALLAFADTCYQQSDGLFDITSGVFRDAWDFKNPVIPTQATLNALLPRVGWKKVHWDAHSIYFSHPGMALDFGGIVKEYAADCAATLCKLHGIHHGIINLGGDINAIGPRADGSPWAVKIRHPRNAGDHLGSVELSRGGLASSGDYERYIEIQGERYCHIISPFTGWPVKGLASVTVQAEQCIVAGAACTIAMLKEQKGSAWLEALGLPYLCMDKGFNVVSRFTPPS